MNIAYCSRDFVSGKQGLRCRHAAEESTEHFRPIGLTLGLEPDWRVSAFEAFRLDSDNLVATIDYGV
ncbi:uncharacterized protein FRV6_16743 [Fusarium oxysporum]|uniref:Uncharacterized protein n=1 Tax=Fusarium oxysporum TaxID=5507 RepID=A0A2H3TYA8_FUSOX|nr:uncharacterized protein FRV6_16743 [Fusarium oxysporum]